MSARSDCPWRLVLASLAVGFGWYAFARFGGSISAELELLPGPLSLEDLWYSALFALAVLVPAWIFRRKLATLPFVATFPASVLALFLFAACLNAGELVGSALFGTAEELQDLHGVLPHLFMPLLLVLLGVVGVLCAVLQTFYVSLPLAWLGVWVLWRASGAPQETPKLRAKQA